MKQQFSASLILASSVIASTVAVPLLAQTPAAPATSVQQDFESATDLTFKTKDYAAALAKWEALEKRLSKSSKSRGVVLTRKARALEELGRYEEAAAAARQGLAAMPAADTALDEDRESGWWVLAESSELALDFAGAADAFRHARDLAAAPADKLRALRGMVSTLTFVDTDAAMAALDETTGLLESVKAEKAALSVFSLAKSELLLARGDFSGARKAANKAIFELGGLDSAKIDPRDATARSDYALAALLAGDKDGAREYLARAGAGRVPEGVFALGVEMYLPQCGGDDGLKPADSAVIEFHIDANGGVTHSRPVYATGGGAAALAFARKAREWSFSPESLAKIPAFFRYNARVELRCTTVLPRQSTSELVAAAYYAWLMERHVKLVDSDESSSATRLGAQRAALLRATEIGDAGRLARVARLMVLADNPVVPIAERNAFAREARAALGADVPPLARLFVDLAVWKTDNGVPKSKAGFYQGAVAGLSDPIYAADPQARSAIAILIADSYYKRSDDAKVQDFLNRIVADTALEKNDPLRVGALVRLASLNLRAGDATAAKSAFEKSGLAAQQCAIIDSVPKLVRSGGTFPDEALKWGFEGWTTVEYDIGADGKVLGPRAVIAYPPFVFNDAGEHALAGTLYAKTYRPDGGLGCGGDRRNVIFRRPN